MAPTGQKMVITRGRIGFAKPHFWFPRSKNSCATRGSIRRAVFTIGALPKGSLFMVAASCTAALHLADDFRSIQYLRKPTSVRSHSRRRLSNLCRRVAASGFCDLDKSLNATSQFRTSPARSVMCFSSRRTLRISLPRKQGLKTRNVCENRRTATLRS